jgi:DNA invertase Pin-like site-specific DNA recombinase
VIAAAALPSTTNPTHRPADEATVPVRTVVCYLRTANPGTAGQRLLDRQRAKLQREAATRGWTVAAWIEDLHQSGATLQRPGLREALALLADHQGDALLATDPARLAVTAEVADRLAAIAGRQGWRLLTVEALQAPAPPSSPPAHQEVPLP